MESNPRGLYILTDFGHNLFIMQQLSSTLLYSQNNVVHSHIRHFYIHFHNKWYKILQMALFEIAILNISTQVRNTKWTVYVFSKACFETYWYLHTSTIMYNLHCDRLLISAVAQYFYCCNNIYRPMKVNHTEIACITQ